jgi:perosamine synthetase
VIELMREQGVETTLGTYALHVQPFFAREYGYLPGDLPGSHLAFRQSLSLPLYGQLGEAEMVRVASALRRSLDQVARERQPAVAQQAMAAR